MVQNTPELTMPAVMKGFTLVDYLAREQQDGQRYEYYRGELFAMVGGTPVHSLIASNFCGEARERLKGKPCVVYNSNLRIKCDSAGLYTYPDASIVCGELELDAELANTVLNPTVIVEVLSDSTEKYDRGRKSMMFRGIKSLKELVLISQDSPSVESFLRQPGDSWRFSHLTELTQSLPLESLGFSIPLTELYRNVVFPSATKLPPLH
jgi:Uma2 family endonuclease